MVVAQDMAAPGSPERNRRRVGPEGVANPTMHEVPEVRRVVHGRKFVARRCYTELQSVVRAQRGANEIWWIERVCLARNVHTS